MWHTFDVCPKFWQLSDDIKYYHQLIIIHQLKHFAWALEYYPPDRINPLLGDRVGNYGPFTKKKIKEWMRKITDLREQRCHVETDSYQLLGMRIDDELGEIALRYIQLKMFQEYELNTYDMAMGEEKVILKQQKQLLQVPNFTPFLNAVCDHGLLQDVMVLQRNAMYKIQADQKKPEYATV